MSATQEAPCFNAPTYFLALEATKEKGMRETGGNNGNAQSQSQDRERSIREQTEEDNANQNRRH